MRTFRLTTAGRLPDPHADTLRALALAAQLLKRAGWMLLGAWLRELWQLT